MSTATALPKWLQANKYKEITGHTTDTLKKLRAHPKVREKTHWKKGITGGIVYNHAAIDRTIDTL